ncbi:MAG TPA: MCE family protein, partial [Candidatus Glassbacteria bacterium]|nr:MCE family protein [Candidatus Glassbacteria bacterium]
LSVRLDAMVADLESGRGTLGRMLKDESLYEELRETALEARNLMREIRDNPEKFINIKAF